MFEAVILKYKFCKQMAKFLSEKEWLSHSQESRNPWSTSCTYIDVGSLGKVIYLAEQIGQLPKEHEKDNQDEIKAKIKSPSIKLIEQIEILGKLITELHKVKERIHHHHLEQGTKDLTNPYILDEKTKKMEELALHFSAIVDKKEELIKRLQQPFVGDYINIDADFQRYVADAIPCLASILSNLTTYMENITWSTQFSLENGEMERILASISTVLAQMQSYFQSLCTSRNIMPKILNEVRVTKK